MPLFYRFFDQRGIIEERRGKETRWMWRGGRSRKMEGVEGREGYHQLASQQPAREIRSKLDLLMQMGLMDAWEEQL